MIRELTQQGICVSLGTGRGGEGSGRLRRPAPRGPGSPSLRAMVSWRDWLGGRGGVSFAWPLWRWQTCHKRGPCLKL